MDCVNEDNWFMRLGELESCVKERAVKIGRARSHHTFFIYI